MRRRDFITLFGGAATWPLAARAQQSAMPVVGFLYSSTMDSFREFMTAFNTGLAETGYVEGRNVAFEYRLAENHFERLPALADDLVRDRVGVIVTASNVPPDLSRGRHYLPWIVALTGRPKL
jgi:putative tryptophan/tyrosine transport system substrate-binding protein